MSSRSTSPSKELFEEAGLEVTPTLAEGGCHHPGVEAGEFQIGFSNVVSLVNATAAGIQLQALTGGMKANEAPDWSAVLVGADSDIQDGRSRRKHGRGQHAGQHR